MEDPKIKILERALKREKAARKIAENILENKSKELYETSLELKKATQQLEGLLDETSSELKGVFENINDAYVVMDLFGNVIKMNDVANDVFEHNIDDSPLNVTDLIYEKDYEYAINSFRKLQEKGYFNNYEARIITKSKSIKWVQINASIIFDKNKNPIAAQGIVRDTTKLKTLELQKEKLLKELEISNNELHEYAHIVSHDLKSPLRSINALMHWIKADNEDLIKDETKKNFDLIDVTLQKMEQLITDILDYSSLGSSIEKKKNVNTFKTIEQLEKILYIPEHISLNYDKNLPTILADKTKISQLFQNLISNSVKFIDKKEGVISISFEEKPSFYEFCVSDNGIGIEKKYHKSIFNIFHSLEKSKESSGIGLNIVKKIVELHKGKIWLESEPKKGTSFYFTISK